MKQLSAILLGIFISIPGLAQKKKQAVENDEAIREFVTVCNSYKQIPLHVVIQQSSTAFIASSPEDTATTEAEFYFTPLGSYVRYGNTEQLSNDSLMVVISNDQRLMMLYTTTENIQQQLNKFTGFQMADSSINKISSHYSAIVFPVVNKMATIELKNKSPLPGTNWGKESITIEYNIETKEPREVIYLRRSLIPVDSSEWATDPAYANWNDKLLKTKESWFVINERTQRYRYKKIDHHPGIQLPVRVGERILHTGKGEFIPAKGFEDYYVSMDE